MKINPYRKPNEEFRIELILEGMFVKNFAFILTSNCTDGVITIAILMLPEGLTFKPEVYSLFTYFTIPIKLFPSTFQ